MELDDYLDINAYDFELFKTFVNHNTFDEKLAVYLMDTIIILAVSSIIHTRASLSILIQILVKFSNSFEVLDFLKD